MIVIDVMASPTSSVVMVPRAVVTMVVDALGPSTSLDAVLHITISPELALDR
jgi:hypothetical protein